MKSLAGRFTLQSKQLKQAQVERVNAETIRSKFRKATTYETISKTYQWTIRTELITMCLKTLERIKRHSWTSGY